MIAFTPTTRRIDPPLDDDPLGAALQRNLRRPIGVLLSWGPWLTLGLAILTFGFAPLVVQSKRFIHIVAVERSIWRHIAEWLDRPEIAARAERLKQPIVWIVLLIASTAFAAIAVGLLLAIAPRDIAAISLWRWSEGVSMLAPAFTFAMTIAFGTYYAIVLRHQRLTRDVIRVFDERIVPPAVSYGARGTWLAMAAAMLLLGIPWAALMMLAGGAQRRYITEKSVATRAAIAEHLSGVGASPTRPN